MRNSLAVFVAAFLLTATASAQAPMKGATVPLGYKLGTSSTGVALNGAAGTRTFVVGPTINNGQQLAGFGKLGFDVDYTWANNGRIVFTCTVLGYADQSGAGTYTIYVPTSGIVSSGTYDLAFGGVVRTPSLTASKSYHFTLGIGSAGTVKCVVSHDGAPNANDKIKVQVTAYAD